LLQDRPIYEALLERDLLRGQDAPELEDTLLLELPVYAGADFEGKAIRELGLPSGCLIVTVQRGLHSLVATPETVLQAGDRLTAVVAPNAAEGATLLREGTGPSTHRFGEPD
jgi:CIC family chloride channel protein